MYKTTLKIDGMMCGMCESHINDTIRKAAPVKKVTSSHAKEGPERSLQADARNINPMQIRIIFVVIEHRPAGFPAGLLYEKPLCRHGDRAVFHDRGKRDHFLKRENFFFS